MSPPVDHEAPASPFAGLPGALWLYRFDAAGRAQVLDATKSGVETLHADDEHWHWLHLDLSDARSAQVVAKLPLPDDAHATLLSPDSHVNLQLDDDAAHGVFVDWAHQRGVDLAAEGQLRGDDGIGWLHFALTPTLLVTARRQALRSVETARRAVGGGAVVDSPVRLLELVAGRFADTVERSSDGLSVRLDRIEDRVLADSIGEERRDLAQLRHQTVRLHRPLTAMRRVLKQFEQRHPADTEHELLPAVSRLNQRLDDLDGDVATLLSPDSHVNLQLEDDAVHGVFVDWTHQRGVDLAAEGQLRGDDGIGWLHFALTPTLLVTARRQALRSVEAARRAVGKGAVADSPVRLLELIAGRFADTVERSSDGLSVRLDRIEDRVLADSIGEERRDLAQLRHQTVRLHRPLTAMRRVLKQFEQRHPADTEHELLPAVARLNQRFDDLDGDVATLQERARLLQDEVAAKLAERTNRHLYVLSMVTALLLPPSLVAGLFGMNLPGLPFAHSTHGLAFALLLGVASSVAVFLALRRMGVSRST